MVVTATDKSNLPKDVSAGRYSDRVKLSFDITNKTDKAIKGIQGNLMISDLFGEKILASKCDFTGNTIPENGSITVSDLGIDINEFMDNHKKFYNTDFADLKFEYKITNIVYDDGSGMEEQLPTEAAEAQNVMVHVTDKQNLDINYSAGRYSPRIQFTFEVSNNTSKDIKGVQGVLTMKDLFGVDIMAANLDFTGQTISANGSATFGEMGIDVNQFMDEHIKVYNTDYKDLIFEYEVKSIVYTDGSTE